MAAEPPNLRVPPDVVPLTVALEDATFADERLALHAEAVRRRHWHPGVRRESHDHVQIGGSASGSDGSAPQLLRRGVHWGARTDQLLISL